MRISTPFVLSVLLIALPAQAQKNSQNPSPKAQPPQQQSAPASGSDSTSAYQSKISAENMISVRASLMGLPCSKVIIRAIGSARLRINSAASRNIFPRLAAGVSRHSGNAAAADAKASSRSVVVA